ncbi:MAG: helix-turn-helix domain-containing protein [Bacteroidota bacterium]
MMEQQSLVTKLKEGVLKKLGNENVSVKDLADLTMMSERSLYRFIKRKLGTTPGRFIREVKLERTRELLYNNCCQNIKEVADKVGFESPGNFSLAFEKKFKVKPGRYLQTSNPIKNSHN